MTIKEVTTQTIHIVTMDDERTYIRHAPQYWNIRMYDNYEEVGDTEELEQMFQEWVRIKAVGDVFRTT